MKKGDINPTEIKDVYWILAERRKGNYPEPNQNSGKWLVFVNTENLDHVWDNIKLATETGLLGKYSKASTAKPNSNAKNKDLKVICVYTYDYTDKEDVMRIREELRKIGIINKIPYKTDHSTLTGQYEVKGNKNISTYYE